MSPSVPLLLLLLVPNAVHGLTWWLGVHRLALPVRAALHSVWHAVLASAALGTACILGAGADSAWCTWCWLLACTLARRGQAVLLHRPLRDAEQTSLLLGIGLACLAMQGGDRAAWLRGLLALTAIAWGLLRMGAEQVEVVGRLFGAAHGWILGAPGLLLGAVCLFHVAAALALPLPGPEAPGAAALLPLSALLSLVWCQASLLYLVGLRLARRLRRPLPDLVLG